MGSMMAPPQQQAGGGQMGHMAQNMMGGMFGGGSASPAVMPQRQPLQQQQGGKPGGAPMPQQPPQFTGRGQGPYNPGHQPNQIPPTGKPGAPPVNPGAMFQRAKMMQPGNGLVPQQDPSALAAMQQGSMAQLGSVNPTAFTGGSFPGAGIGGAGWSPFSTRR